MTHVLIDGRSLHDPDSRHRGFGVFLRSLLEGLADRSDLDVSVLVERPTPGLPSGRPVRVQRLATRRFGATEHAIRLGFDIRRASPDVFHSPGLDPPWWSPAPWVQTLHDVTPLLYDHPDFARDRRRWRTVFSRMRKARAVAAISRFSAEAGIRIAGLDPGRVHVVPNGVDRRFVPPAVRETGDPPYILYVGVYGPHKGYHEAFGVADELARRGYAHRLKIVGTLNPWRRARIAELRRGTEHPDRIDLMGFVADADLLTLYARATALIVTSRCEGFGLPAVEAMATGTPVVSFDNTALPEVIDGGGVLVGDADVTAMCDEVSDLIDDEARWEELSRRGIARAHEFDWSRTATSYAEIYRDAAGVERR